MLWVPLTDGLGRTVPQVSNELENSALPGFWRLGFFDRLDVLAPKTKWQAIKGRSRFRDLVQSCREISRLWHYSWLSVGLKNNLDPFSFGDAACGSIGCADSNQALPAHEGYSASPGMTID